VSAGHRRRRSDGLLGTVTDVSEGCRSLSALECLLDTVVDVLTVFLAQSLMCQKAAAVDQLLSVCWTQTSTF